MDGKKREFIAGAGSLPVIGGLCAVSAQRCTLAKRAIP
jgi:hypothetical protein